jgi:hypothetical protein
MYKTLTAISEKFIDRVNVDTIQYPSMYIVYAINPITNQAYVPDDLNNPKYINLFIKAMDDIDFIVSHREYLNVLINNYCIIHTSKIYDYEVLLEANQAYYTHINSLIMGNNHPLINICYNVFNYLHTNEGLGGFVDAAAKYTYMYDLLKHIVNIYHAATSINTSTCVYIFIDSMEHPVYTLCKCLAYIMNATGSSIVTDSSLLYEFILIYYEFDILEECAGNGSGNVFDALVKLYFGADTHYTRVLIAKMPERLIDDIDTLLSPHEIVTAFSNKLCNKPTDWKYQRKLFKFIKDTNIIAGLSGTFAHNINKPLPNSNYSQDLEVWRRQEAEAYENQVPPPYNSTLSKKANQVRARYRGLGDPRSRIPRTKKNRTGPMK